MTRPHLETGGFPKAMSTLWTSTPIVAQLVRDADTGVDPQIPPAEDSVDWDRARDLAIVILNIEVRLTM